MNKEVFGIYRSLEDNNEINCHLFLSLFDFLWGK